MFSFFFQALRQRIGLSKLSAATLVVFGSVWMVGCQSKPAEHSRVLSPDEFTEPSLAEQMQAVRSGATDRIHLIKTAVTDQDLTEIAQLSSLRELLIDESCVSSDGLRQLESLKNLEHLRIRGIPLRDEALAAVAKIPSLKILNMPHGDFTDAGVQSLRELHQLVQVRLGSSTLTDQSLATLVQMPSVLRIHLLEAPITDEGLKCISNETQLESLYLDGSQITEQGLRELFATVPQLHVHVNQAHVDFDPHANDHKHD